MAKYPKRLKTDDLPPDEDEEDDYDDDEEDEELPPPPPKKPLKPRAKKPEEHDCEWKKKYEIAERALKAEKEVVATLNGELMAMGQRIKQYDETNERLTDEANSASASFSEALRQVGEYAKALKAAEKEVPGKVKVFKLANAALELAKYARALEGKEPTPGHYITQVEELVKGMV